MIRSSFSSSASYTHIIRFKRRHFTEKKLRTIFVRSSVCRKSLFLKLTSDLLSLSPLGHSVGFASCKAWCVLISASLPKTPFPGERLCMLGWLCIVQSLWAYTPGVRAGLSVGLPPSPRLGLRPKPHFNKLYKFLDRLFKYLLILKRHHLVNTGCVSSALELC